MAAHIPVKS